MPSYTLTRFAINALASLGVAKVVGDIIKNNTVALTTTQKILVNSGGLVLGSMIVDQASNHVNETIDNLIEWRRQNSEQNNSQHTEPAPPTPPTS